MSYLQTADHPTGKKIKIFIDGKVYTVHSGETVLSALVASGYKSLKKSRKMGEPRGPLCGMGVCYECL